MKAGLYTCVLALLCLASVGLHAAPTKSKAKAGTTSPFRFNVQAGYSEQSFSIPRGADFKSIGQSYFSVGIQKMWPIWTMGVQYFSVGPANLRSFWINDTTEGQYKISFQRYQFFMGFHTERAQYLVLVGTESTQWSGSPDLALKKKASSHAGFLWSYDAFSLSSFKVPVVLTVLNHPSRTFEFANYPGSTIQVAAGVEYSIGTGFSFGF